MLQVFIYSFNKELKSLTGVIFLFLYRFHIVTTVMHLCQRTNFGLSSIVELSPM